ncbi:hypothetical protein BKH46_04695 [Helicobacter sp. 12S02634-8]|uniref:hypothetical protein n=1 Tax=Helicobacter sp. 12S02634-8 TaxID=1476199 RepID=UPI000BA66480|nr:hypothetical protein [Helicobacter sp. 12S02634-8]PAF47381.1 hypothetical protein BKH46_04695 [Helicobacter sp. 12S02634-8]
MQANKYLPHALLALLIALYGLGIIWGSDFSVIDDHTLSVFTLMHHPIPFFIAPEIGRFYPLNAQEWNLIAPIFGTTPKVFYIFNALMMVLVSLCVLAILRLWLPLRSGFVYLFALFVLLISPNFATAFLRLFVPEKMEIVFLSLFMLSYTLFCHKQKPIYACIGVLMGFIAMFYKETAFILIGVFALFHFLFAYKTSSKASKIFDISLLFVSAIWLCIYLGIIWSAKNNSSFYGASPLDTLTTLAKVTFSYIFDPIILIAPLSFISLKLWLVLKNKASFHPVFDAALIAGLVFMFAYLKLGIANYHYPLPTYIFFLVPLVAYFIEYFKYKFVKILFALCIFLYGISTLPSFIYTFAHYKFVPQNFQSTLSFLTDYTRTHNGTTIYLQGVNRASGTEVYTSFIRWLKFYGAKDFDFASDLPIDNPLLSAPDPTSPYTLFQNNLISKPKTGDLLILTPYSDDAFYPTIKALKQKNYPLLFLAHKGWNIPKIGIKNIAKYFYNHFYPQNTIGVNHNNFGLPLYFYVYEVR